MRVIKFILFVILTCLAAYLVFELINDYFQDDNKNYIREHLLKSAIESKLPVELAASDREVVLELSTEYIKESNLEPIVIRSAVYDKLHITGELYTTCDGADGLVPVGGNNCNDTAGTEAVVDKKGSL